MQRPICIGISGSTTRRGVKLLIDELAAGGGYVFSASYVIGCNTPAEHIVAMFDEAHECGEYPLCSRGGASRYLALLQSFRPRFG